MTQPDPPVSFAAKPTLTGALVTLRPVVPDDAGHFLAVDAESLRLTGTRQEHTAEQLAHWYAGCAARCDRLDLAVIDRSTGGWAGEAVLVDLDPDDRSCTLRLLLAGPRFIGRGLGTETVRLLLAHAFDAVGLRRVQLEVRASNKRAAHVYRKVGFRVEGVARGTQTMAILRDEWAATAA